MYGDCKGDISNGPYDIINLGQLEEMLSDIAICV